MTKPATISSTADVLTATIAVCKAAVTARSIASPDERVWSVIVPGGVPLPYAVCDVEENKDQNFEDKEHAPVVAFPTVEVWGGAEDYETTTQLAAEIQERMTDDAALSGEAALSGWAVHVAALNFNQPMHEITADGPKRLGRLMQFEWHLEQ